MSWRWLRCPQRIAKGNAKSRTTQLHWNDWNVTMWPTSVRLPFHATSQHVYDEYKCGLHRAKPRVHQLLGKTNVCLSKDNSDHIVCMFTVGSSDRQQVSQTNKQTRRRCGTIAKHCQPNAVWRVPYSAQCLQSWHVVVCYKPGAAANTVGVTHTVVYTSSMFCFITKPICIYVHIFD